MSVPEQKLARGGSASLVSRGTVAYVTSAVTVTTYSLTSLIRHLMVTTNGANAITVTLPPVAEAAGQIYSVVLDVDGGVNCTVTDAGDDADFTDIVLDDEDDFCVLISNGVKWMFLQKDAIL